MLDELIARLEAATEGSRELDAEIWRVADPPACKIADYQSRAFTGRDWTEEEKAEAVAARMKRLAPHFTTSLDAALTLVPEGCAFRLQKNLNGKYWVSMQRKFPDQELGFDIWVDAYGPTIVLALCIAALKARAA